MKKKIGIIGSGAVAQSLGTGFLKHGYKTMLGTRDPVKLKDWLLENSGAEVGSFEDTAAFGDIIVLAVGGSVAQNALGIADLENLEGKTVIDATNPIAKEAPENGVLKFFTDLNHSLMESLQDYAPKVNFVKAFNSVGNAHMVDPDFESTPTMFICGNNEKAKKEVEQILKDFGWEVEDMGGAESARAIEPLCILWCIPGMLRQEWSHAFKLLKK
ncbi:MAG: NAD(P)-binding domain-containing protein [Crocinitomicaceae bacterium]|nr:NAD(P)-binding domain-containing protein [Crocinitomicaceae bacterium]